MTEHCDVEALSPREGDATKTAMEPVTPVSVDVEADSDAACPDAPFSRYGAAVRAMWSEPDASAVQVRGPTYTVDGVKVPSGAALGSLLHVDVWDVGSGADAADRRLHVARAEEQRADSLLLHCRRESPDALVFILNIALPTATNTCLVAYWLVPKLRDAVADAARDPARNFERLLWAFCNAEDDDFRTRRFKLIPDFANAPWVFQQLVPSRPAITGTKLTQHYFRRHNYFELDLDVASSTIASSIGSLCCSWATYLDVRVFVTIQGEAEDELPERVLGGVSFKYVDLAAAAHQGDEL
ncbi:hypothetical protein PybrP1_000272 [[Pythium] brassicae (nom. inval.)]|nr:hypothetical protein PybrP1_000272 [[Pythium] brassicae (nom. inval.)]